MDGTIIYITTHMFFEDLASVQDSLPEEVIVGELDPVEENVHDSASSGESLKTDEDFDLPLQDGSAENPNTRMTNRESDKTDENRYTTDETIKTVGGTRESDVPSI